MYTKHVFEPYVHLKQNFWGQMQPYLQLKQSSSALFEWVEGFNMILSFKFKYTTWVAKLDVDAYPVF